MTEYSNPWDFGSILPEDISSTDVDLSQYLPEPLPEETAPSPATGASGEQNLAYAYDYFLKKGFKPHQAAAIVGNLAQESGGRTGAEGGNILPGEAYSYGLAQHNKERLHGGGNYTGLLPFAKSRGTHPSDLNTQLDYIMHELQGPERGAYDALMQAPDVASATRAFGKAYERPSERYANYDNRIAQAQKFLGSSQSGEPEIPTEETYDIPLSNGQTFTVPKSISKEDAIAGLRAQGMNVEGVKTYELTNERRLTLPESFDVNEALKQLQAQHPDEEWVTKDHAEKTGFIPAAKAAATGLGATLLRGPSEVLEEIPALSEYGKAGIKKSKEWEEAARGMVERPLETDPLSKKLAYYGGTAAGAFAPIVAGAAIAPEATVPALLGGTMASTATGSLAQRFDEQGKPFAPQEHIPAIAGETALQYAGTAVLGPLRAFVKSPALGQILGKDASTQIGDIIATQGFDAAKKVVGQRAWNIAKEAGLNITSMGAGDIGSMLIERVASGQPLEGKHFEDELYDTIKTDLMGGGVMGPVSGVMRQKGLEKAYADRVAEAQQTGPQPIEVPPEAPTAGGAAAPAPEPTPSGEGETIEDLQRAAQPGEDFFRRAQEQVATEEPAPMTEQPEVQAPPVPEIKEPSAWFPEITGLKSNTGVAKRFKSSGLDISNPEDHQAIIDLIKAEEAQKSTALKNEHATAIVDNINAQRANVGLEPVGEEYASKIQGPEPFVPGRSARPQGGEEVGYPSEGGEGVRVSDQIGQGVAGEGEIPEVKAPEKIETPQAPRLIQPPEFAQLRAELNAQREKLGLSPYPEQPAEETIPVIPETPTPAVKAPTGETLEQTSARLRAEHGLEPKEPEIQKAPEIPTQMTDKLEAELRGHNMVLRKLGKPELTGEGEIPEEIARAQKIEAQYQENKKQAEIRKQQAANMSVDELQNLRDSAIAENERLDIEAIGKHFGADQAKAYADMNRRQREAWWDKNATEALEDDSSVMKGIDENELQDYIDAHSNVFGDNARDLGRNVALHLRNSDRPEWVNSPDYVAIKEAFKLADKEGWDRAEVIQGMRERVRKYAGEDAPELFERLFRAEKAAPPTEVKAPEVPTQMTDKLEAELRGHNMVLRKLGKPELTPEQFLAERKFAKAEEPTHIDVDGVQRPVHDSTGQRIHTTDEGVKNFWKNLGETKVVDEEGRPIKVYRALTTEWEDKPRDNLQWFSESPADAEDYTGSAEGANVVPAYIALKHPADLTNDTKVRKIIEDAGDDPDDLFDVTYNQNIKDLLGKAGYDGVIAYHHDSEAYHYAPFDPEQIKSAIGNKGTFDATKRDIREARGVAPETAHTVESLNDHIVKTYGKNAPRVEVSTASAEGVEPNVKGFYDPNQKKVVLIADNIGKGEDIHGLMRHEVAIHAKRLGKSDPEFQAILEHLQKLKDQGNTQVVDAYNRVPKNTKAENTHEEALAYLSQHAPNLPIVKRFTSWMRRTAHSLTGNANWLKAEDFGPMADAILKKGEPKVTKAETPSERLFSVDDEADQAVRHHVKENWFDRLYTSFRTRFVSSTSPVETLLGKMPMFDAQGEMYGKAKLAQQTRHSQIISNALESGYLRRNESGINEAVHHADINPTSILQRISNLPEDVRNRFAESMVTLAQAGHNLRGAEMKAVMDDTQNKISVGQKYLDKIKSDYEKAKANVEFLKPKAEKNKALESALKEAEAKRDRAKAIYESDEYADGKSHVATQQKLLKAVKDQFNKAKRDESGKIYDISPEQEKAAQAFLNSTPENRKLTSDIRELFKNNAKFLKDNQVISEETYKKFIDSKYNYAPLYMSIEDLESAIPAAVTYLQGGQRQVMTVKGLKGSPHVVNLFQNILTHQARTGAMGLFNNARHGALKDLEAMGYAKRLPAKVTPKQTQNVVAVMEDGKRHYYEVENRDLLDAFEVIRNLPMPEWVMSIPRTFSRMQLINPKYWYNQLAREPLMATLSSRAGMITPVHAGKELASLFYSGLTKQDTNAAKFYRDLKGQGVTGSHEYLRDLIKEKGQVAADTGMKKMYDNSLDLVMKIHEYVDASTKVAMMRKLIKKAESGELTGTPLKGDAARDAAIFHVGDMLNFANRGRSSTMRYIAQTTPFINSWAQGLDSLVRQASGYGMTPEMAAKARKNFAVNAAALTAFSTAVAIFLAENSEDFRNADPEEVFNNWLFPMPKALQDKEGRMFHAKGPFELNTIFRVLPTMLVRNYYGLDRNIDYGRVFMDTAWKDLAPPGAESGFTLFAIKPLVEALMGSTIDIYNGVRPIGDQTKVAFLRGRGESPIADALAFGGISPAMVQHIGKGYFGEGYTSVDSLIKGIASTFGSKTARADLRDITEKVPWVSALVTNPDKINSRAAYDFADEQEQNRSSLRYANKRHVQMSPEEEKRLREGGRYAKAVKKQRDNISEINSAIERLKNTEEFKDANAAQKRMNELIARKKRGIHKIEELRSKSEK